ncbi:MAG: acetylxylan esterase [Acidobacteria bacterium]|nr:acetylxylan esterase [Acidobacteriota bacterium]
MTRALLLLLASTALLWGQSKSNQVRQLLEPPLTNADLAAQELRQYFFSRIPKLPAQPTAASWTAEQKRIREKVLREVVYNGWPQEWVKAPLKVEDRGVIQGEGYRVRKLRYEIVPGFWGAALLYEPEKPAVNAQGKAPGIVNVNGHVGPIGKAVDYKQKRCIQYARMGIYAVNLEWLQYGELSGDGNIHYNGAHLDLIGMNGLGIFYLNMRKGIDILWEHANVDRARIGVTGLSGGGWQTITLGSLEERVAAAMPVAGYSAMISKLERTADMGDHEQSATDLLAGQEYTHFTAMLAPRPALIAHNAEDDCCFRAPLVKPHIYDAIVPFYRAYGKESLFEWHENRDPADHNYEWDNRMASYRFFAKSFGLKAPEQESNMSGEIHTREELTVGLPGDNLSILGLARREAAKLGPRQGTAAELKTLLRYQPVEVRHAWALRGTKSKGVESTGYRIDFANGLSATAVWLANYERPAARTITIMLADGGKKDLATEASDRLNGGDSVLVVDPMLIGDETPVRSGSSGAGLYARFFYMTGERPLAVQAAQLAALAGWVKATYGAAQVRVVSKGPRSQMIGLAAKALESVQISEINSLQGMATLGELLERPGSYLETPEVFSFGLYKTFDIKLLKGIH